jgi:hypothetical protein
MEQHSSTKHAGIAQFMIGPLERAAMGKMELLDAADVPVSMVLRGLGADTRATANLAEQLHFSPALFVQDGARRLVL